MVSTGNLQLCHTWPSYQFQILLLENVAVLSQHYRREDGNGASLCVSRCFVCNLSNVSASHQLKLSYHKAEAIQSQFCGIASYRSCGYRYCFAAQSCHFQFQVGSEPSNTGNYRSTSVSDFHCYQLTSFCICHVDMKPHLSPHSCMMRCGVDFCRSDTIGLGVYLSIQKRLR